MSTLELQLQQTQKELASLKQEYQEFAYIISHDLKAPFRTIDGFATLLAEKNSDCLDEKAQRYLNLIKQGAEQGSGIVDALLKFSRLSSQSTHFETVNVNEIITEVQQSLTAEIESSQAILTIGDMPTITADKKLLTKVFYELIKNALTYHIPKQKPLISVSSLQDSEKIEFFIKDNGIGVKDSRKEIIFKVLRRAVTQEDYPGEGMGLAIVTQIIQRHGGTVSIESEKDQGAVFSFSIPKQLANQDRE